MQTTKWYKTSWDHSLMYRISLKRENDVLMQRHEWKYPNGTIKVENWITAYPFTKCDL